MKSRQLFLALALGLSLTAILLLCLTHLTMVVHADPGTFYVRAGAAGDCLSTATPCGSVQQAINLATTPGDEVYVATGTYVENLIITHSVKLRGGWNVSFTAQNPISTPTTFDGNGEHNVRVENTLPQAQIAIEDLTLRNGKDGIHIWTGNLTVERCTIHDASKQGIEIDGGTVLISATRILTTQQGIEVDDGTVQVTNVHIAHTVEEGLLIEGGGAITFTGSIIENCTQQGIQVNQGTLWLFDNSIHHITADGIRIEGGNVSIVSNTVYAIESDGIDARGSQIISGNQVYDTGRRGISAHDGALTVLDNQMSDISDDGIRAADGTTVTICGNTVFSAGNDGIDARGMTVTIASNLIYEVRDRGINAENGILTITNNTIRNTDSDGIRTSGSSTEVEIQGNAIYTAGNDGIDARGNVIHVSHNTVSHCADNGLRSEGDESAHIEANQILDNAIGLAIRGASLFTVANNVIGDHITASVELTGTGSGALYHNTLVGSSAGARGVGLAVLDPMTVTLANNIIVSHNVGFSATAGATLIAHHTLLWANGDDPVSVTLGPPRFTAPEHHDYHLLPGSPAIDAGADVGVTNDADGNPRPIGDRPDIGADEFPAALQVSKWAAPILVQPGAPLTYTILVANTGVVTLTTTITDVLPDHVSPAGTRVWTSTVPAPSGVWTQTIVITPDVGYIGPLVNVVWAASDEGAMGVYTYTLAPGVQVAKRADPRVAQLGKPLTYTIYVTNTGNFRLNTTITDVLSNGVAPIAPHTWTATLAAPGDVWTATIAITVAANHTGPLVNVVQVASDEGATDIYTHTLAPSLDVVKRASPDPAQAGERLTYTIYVTNTGDFYLHAIVTDTLPTSVTLRGTSGGTLVLPGGTVGVTWTAVIPMPGDVWTRTIVVDTAADYVGPLTNIVQVTTDEGATGNYALVSSVVEEHAIYLPLILRSY